MIILIRHGQTTTNAKSLLVGRSDPSLTELGERQARALAPFLEGVKEVWTSPLVRARETARLALPHVPALVKESFIEVDYGDLEGQPLSVVSAKQWEDFETDHELALGNGESLASVDRRVHAQLDELLADPTSLLHQAHEHLAIVSHVSPIKSATVWALGVPGSVAWRTRLDNGSITTIATRRSSPSLVRFNMVPALR
ncbi:MAG: histidine phosphatase family protein [Acidimicrobiales bacterium]